MRITFSPPGQADSSQDIQQIAKLRVMVSRLSEKAGLHGVPGFFISKKEQFASVNLFQFRICAGQTLLSFWTQGEFDESDVEAIIAHEIGHLMDFKRGSRSASFRNLLLESAWFSCGLVPLVISILFPSLPIIRLCAMFALGWIASIPLLIRRFERKIEFEADKNAVLYLVEPEHLANALTKMKALTNPVKFLAPLRGLTGFVGRMTHPSFNDRIDCCVHQNSKKEKTSTHFLDDPVTFLKKIKMEESHLMDEKRRLSQQKVWLQKRITDKIEIRMEELLQLKTETDELKAECLELNKVLENEVFAN